MIKFFKTRKISTQIILLFSVIAIVFFTLEIIVKNPIEDKRISSTEKELIIVQLALSVRDLQSLQKDILLQKHNAVLESKTYAQYREEFKNELKTSFSHIDDLIRIENDDSITKKINDIKLNIEIYHDKVEKLESLIENESVNKNFYIDRVKIQQEIKESSDTINKNTTFLAEKYENDEISSINLLNKLAWIEIVLFIIFSGCVLIVANSVSNHLQEFTQTVKQVKNQDWSKKITSPNNLESHALAEEINEMIGFLKETTLDLKEKNRLYESKLYLNFLIEQLDVSLWTYDLETKEISSTGSHKVLGYSVEEFSADTNIFLNNVVAEDKPLVTESFAKLMEVGESDYDYQFVRKDGRIVWINNKCKITYDNGKASKIFGFMSNIDGRKKSEETIKKQDSLLMQSAKMSTIGEIASSIVHEIKNPLLIIGASVEILSLMAETKDDNLVTEVLQSTKTIEKAVERVNKIIKSLTINSRSVRDPFEDVSINTVIDDCLEIISGKAKNNRVKIEVECKEDLLVSGRASDLGQVLVNLVNNSIDAISSESNQNRWIKISGQELDSCIRITVTDCGLGVPESVVSKMFDSFYTTKEVGKGTGLGLSISKKVVEDHNGKMYYNYKCANTSFIVDLPRPVTIKKVA